MLPTRMWRERQPVEGRPRLSSAGSRRAVGGRQGVDLPAAAERKTPSCGTCCGGAMALSGPRSSSALGGGLLLELDSQAMRAPIRIVCCLLLCCSSTQSHMIAINGWQAGAFIKHHYFTLLKTPDFCVKASCSGISHCLIQCDQPTVLWLTIFSCLPGNAWCKKGCVGPGHCCVSVAQKHGTTRAWSHAYDQVNGLV
jgi:hypothetical protein